MSCRVFIALTLFGAGPGFAEPATEDIDFHHTYEASKGEQELATEQYDQAYGTYSIDEALAVLGSDWKTSQSRHWFTRGMPALAETLAAAGRFGEAADAYRIMAEADDKRANKAHRSWAALRMAAMLAEAGDSDAAGMVYTDLLARNDVSEDDREQAKAALAELLSGLKGGAGEKNVVNAEP